MTRHEEKQSGFTLIEVMISLLIFTVVLAGMAPAFVAQLKHNTNSAIRTEAIAAAQIVIDQLRVEDPATLPASGDGSEVNLTVGNHDFAVTPSFCETATFCTTVNNRHITVRVRYNNEQVFSTQTVFTQLR